MALCSLDSYSRINHEFPPTHPSAWLRPDAAVVTENQGVKKKKICRLRVAPKDANSTSCYKCSPASRFRNAPFTSLCLSGLFPPFVLPWQVSSCVTIISLNSDRRLRPTVNDGIDRARCCSRPDTSYATGRHRNSARTKSTMKSKSRWKRLKGARS